MKFRLAFVLIVVSGIAYSQALVTDRPSQTEASSTVGKGVFQIESGFTFMTEDYETALGSTFPTAPGRQQNIALPFTSWRLGLAERLELRLATQPTLQKQFVDDIETNSVFGIADLQVGFKLNVLKGEGRWPELAIISHAVLPTGTNGISGEEYGVINKLAVSHQLSTNHSLGWNFGFDYLGADNKNMYYSLLWTVSLTDRLSVFLEPYGVWLGLDAFNQNADAGFAWLINDDMQVDYSFGVGINNDMNFHSLGFSFRFDRN